MVGAKLSLGVGLLVVGVLGSLVSAQSANLAFDVASVKPNTSNAPPTARFPLGPGDAFTSDDLFSATNQPLITYLRFAFQLGQGDLLDLASWVYNDRFDVEARASGSPTKNQMRQMVRALLEDRFRLAWHAERRRRPVFNLVKAGTTGPQLRRHVDDCAVDPLPTSGLQLPPIPCGTAGNIAASTPGRGRLAGRAVTIDRLAQLLANPFTGIDRPVIDRTGLSGPLDFTLEWALPPELGQLLGAQAVDAGPSILEALKGQLGLKLSRANGVVEVVVIDRIEWPSPN